MNATAGRDGLYRSGLTDGKTRKTRTTLGVFLERIRMTGWIRNVLLRDDFAPN